MDSSRCATEFQIDFMLWIWCRHPCSFAAALSPGFSSTSLSSRKRFSGELNVGMSRKPAGSCPGTRGPVGSSRGVRARRMFSKSVTVCAPTPPLSACSSTMSIRLKSRSSFTSSTNATTSAQCCSSTRSSAISTKLQRLPHWAATARRHSTMRSVSSDSSTSFILTWMSTRARAWVAIADDSAGQPNNFSTFSRPGASSPQKWLKSVSADIAATQWLFHDSTSVAKRPAARRAWTSVAKYMSGVHMEVTADTFIFEVLASTMEPTNSLSWSSAFALVSAQSLQNRSTSPCSTSTSTSLALVPSAKSAAAAPSTPPPSSSD